MKQLLLICVALVGCTERDPDYCDALTPCLDGRRCVIATRTCVPGNSSDGGADADVGGTCTKPSDCAAAGLVCNSGACVRCDHADAGVQNGISAECDATDHGRPFCGGDGRCIACRDAADCAAARKTCVAGACAPCSAHDQCTSRYCDDETSECAIQGDTLYVDGAGASCANGSGSGTLADPYCKIQLALTNVSPQQQTVVVFAGTYQENLGINVPPVDYTARVFGVGSPIVKPFAFGQPVLSIQGDNNHTINVAFRGFELREGGSGGDGLRCNAIDPAKTLVALTRSTVTNNAGYGVFASNCGLTLDRDLITANDKGGVYGQTSDVVLENSVIFRNGRAGNGGSSFGGVYLASGGNKVTRLFNDTIVYNDATATAAASAIVCGMGSPVLANLAIFGNTGGLVEIAPTCMIDHGAYPGALPPGVNLSQCTAADIFTDAAADKYQPVPTGSCSLVDKGAASSGGQPAPDHDVDGAHRPMNQIDIGAYER